MGIVEKVKEILKNEKGNVFIYFIILIFILIGVTALVLDISNLYVKSKKIKHAVNRAVNAGALQILEGETLLDGTFIPSEELADGIFKIDETKAAIAFQTILAHNVGLDENTLEPLEKSLVYEKPVIKELVVENDTPKVYTSLAIGKSYELENPNIVAVLDFKIRGVFLKNTIRVFKLSSSQLTTIYD